MAYKMEDVLKRYLNRQCTAYTVDEEFYGEIAEVGEGFVLLSDDGSDTVVNLSQVTAIQVDFES